SACVEPGPDLEGTYAVAAIEESTVSCEGGVTPANPPSHFLVVKDTFLGQPIFTMTPCTSAEADSCGAAGGSYVYETTDDGGYRGEIAGFIGSPETTCSLFFTDVRATVDGDTVVWRRDEHVTDGV